MSEEDSNGWQLTESDPGVFTEFLKSLGSTFIVDDLYSLHSETLTSLAPIHALIFLFKWIPTDTSSTQSSAPAGERDSEFTGFFAHQVVQNACATLAVLNALGNIPNLKCGTNLTELINFTAGMDPQSRGLVLTSADWLRQAHNALSPPSSVSLDGLGLPKSTEDAYHFVVYTPIMGALYELDGLQEFPVRHGPYEEKGEGWLKTAREVIEARIATYPMGALEFSLLALRDDPLPSLQDRLRNAESSRSHAEISDLMSRIAIENSKRERWAFENSLRRHNHLGLVHGLALAMAKAGQLARAGENAKVVMQQRIDKRAARGEEAMEDE